MLKHTLNPHLSYRKNRFTKFLFHFRPLQLLARLEIVAKVFAIMETLPTVADFGNGWNGLNIKVFAFEIQPIIHFDRNKAEPINQLKS